MRAERARLSRHADVAKAMDYMLKRFSRDLGSLMELLGLLDDVAQDVFLVVYRRLGAFEGRSTLKTWLFGITLRLGLVGLPIPVWKRLWGLWGLSSWQPTQHLH